MIDKTFAQVMAAYNAWQNDSIYAAADSLTDEARRLDRGAFFNSIHGTLSHLLWADRVWLSRFTGSIAPAGGIKTSSSLFDDWSALKHERKSTDDAIKGWTETFAAADVEGDISWHSGAMNRDITMPRTLVIAHFFNHQTHHRGQAHAMLTAAGAKPLDTDLIFMAGIMPQPAQSR